MKNQPNHGIYSKITYSKDDVAFIGLDRNKKGDVEELGLQPIGKYCNSDSFSFGDANYRLLKILGQKEYSKVELEIYHSVNNKDKREGEITTPKGVIEWKMITEEQYGKQQNN